jgi:hypothetical protein
MNKEIEMEIHLNIISIDMGERDCIKVDIIERGRECVNVQYWVDVECEILYKSSDLNTVLIDVGEGWFSVPYCEGIEYRNLDGMRDRDSLAAGESLIIYGSNSLECHPNLCG